MAHKHLPVEIRMVGHTILGACKWYSLECFHPSLCFFSLQGQQTLIRLSLSGGKLD